MFEVNLIKVKGLNELSGIEVFDLMCNATHVAGDYWIFEGMIEALICQPSVIATGITGGTDDFSNAELVNHCEEIFGVDLSNEPKSYDMY